MGDPEAMRWTHTQPSLPALRRYLAGHARRCRRIGFGGLYDDPFDPG